MHVYPYLRLVLCIDYSRRYPTNLAHLDDFLEGTAFKPFIALASQTKNLYAVKSMTKMYAILGLRFGYGVAHPTDVAKMAADRDGWSVNSLAQVATVAALQDAHFRDQTHTWLRAERDFVEKTWSAHPTLVMTRPSVNFFLVRFSSADVVDAVVTSLLEEGILVRRCEDFRLLGPSYIRMAIRTRKENERLFTSVTKLLVHPEAK